jgi:ABC-type Zn uptake system ZnuABC Zn-binding protein ZnuA
LIEKAIVIHLQILPLHRIKNLKEDLKMKKSMLMMFAAASMLFVLGCGPSAEEQEKAKQEILAIEASQVTVDSTQKEVSKTASELDSLLQQLNAN